MSSIAETAAALRRRIVASRLSFRRVAANAGISDSVVRRLVASGNTTFRTLAKIESALDALQGREGEIAVVHGSSSGSSPAEAEHPGEPITAPRGKANGNRALSGKAERRRAP